MQKMESALPSPLMQAITESMSPSETTKRTVRKGSSSHISGYPDEFIVMLDATITEAKIHNTTGALLLLSIDNLAMVVSGYGREVSEELMQQLCISALEIVGEHDHVMRIQRDQFGIVLKQINAPEVEYLCQRILSHIHQFTCYSQYGALHVMCSLTSVQFPQQTQSAGDALDKAFITLHDGGERTIRAYDSQPQLSELDREQMGLANYLSKAVQERRLKFAYQPIIDAKTGEVAHYEALLRMCSDDGKISSAGALIPVAERMGLIDMIDELTLEMVVEDLLHSPEVKLAFNVSNMTTGNPKWLNRFATLMDEYPDVASRLTVEITETAAQRDLRRTAYFVAQIQALGCMVALDDFGSGYTSFRQLKSLSVDMVKIDGAFIKDLVDNADNRFFVRTLLDFTNGFGLKSVAEFVETGEVAKMLMDLGVDYLQGYYLGKPENHRSWLDGGEYSSDN